MSIFDRNADATASMPAMPARAKGPLSLWQIVKTRGADSLCLFDETVFDELFVERRLLRHRIFVISDPAGVRRILVDNFANYHRHFLMRQPVAPGLGSGMLINDGTVWERHRRLLNPLLDHRAMLPDAPGMVVRIEQLARRLDRFAPGEEFDLGRLLGSFIANSVSDIFAGSGAKLRPMIAGMGKFPGQRRLGDFLPLPDWLLPWGRQIRAEAQSWYPLLDRLIAERQCPHYAGGQDLLWRLVHAQMPDGDRLSHQEVRDEVLTLALGGIYTTLRPLTWVWYLLALYPSAEARLHAELAATLGDRSPTPSDLRRLDYLRRLLDETMRLYPPVPAMLRSAVADDVVCGRRIPSGSTVVVAPWVIHRHRKLWRDPDRFDPERFVPGEIASRSRYSYLPFALGPRACIGAPMAMLQLQIAIAMLASRFRFRLVPGQTVRPAGWTTLRPDGGIRATVEKRGLEA